jgi:L-asparaginase
MPNARVPKKVLFAFTGGTISMKVDPVSGGAVPALSGREILAMTPDIECVVAPEVMDFARLAGPHMTPDHAWRLSEALAAALAADTDIAGVVVTHGTDTLEESAFLVDLRWTDSRPVVFTGAMRNSSEVGFDGPRNLLAAARVAADAGARDQGVLIVLNDTVHAAADAVKTDTQAVETYASPVFGALGLVEPDGIFWRRRIAPDRRFTLPGFPLEPRVELIPAAAGTSGLLIDCAREAGAARGIVISGTGRGNVPPSMIPAIQRAIDAGLPVVMASRCAHGRILDTYAYEGAGRDLRRRGVLFAGVLPPHKARIKLMIVLGACPDDPARVRALMEQGLYPPPRPAGADTQQDP